MSSIVATLYTTEGDEDFILNMEQLMELSIQLQDKHEPVYLKTTKSEHYVVGMMIQGRTFTDYPRIIVVKSKENAE